MGRVVLRYGWRHKEITVCATWNDALGFFTPEGELVGVATCDPDGVYVWGRDCISSHSYIGEGRYEVEYEEGVKALPVVYAYKTRKGRKFVFCTGKDTLVSVRVGERLPDKLDEEGKLIGLLSLDGWKEKAEIDVPIAIDEVFGEEKYIPLAKIYGVRNPQIAERIFRHSYDRKGLFHEPHIILDGKDFIYGYWWTYIGLFRGYNRKGVWGYHITRSELETPPAVVYTASDIEEAWETLKGILAFQGEKLDAKLWLPPSEPGHVLLGDLFAVEYERLGRVEIFYDRNGNLRKVEVPCNKEEELFASASWTEEDRRILKELGILK